MTMFVFVDIAATRRARHVPPADQIARIEARIRATRIKP